MNIAVFSGSFTDIFQWVLHHGYPIMLFGMVVEGPLVTMAASFAASMHVFNVFAVFGLAIAGDIIGDFVWFGTGYYSRSFLHSKFGHFLGISGEKMDKLKTLLEKHPGKIITAIKLSPFLPVPGLIAAGSSHMSPKKFFVIISKIIIPKSILFVVVGYFFGGVYDRIAKYIDNTQIAVGIIVVLVVIFYFIYRKVSGKLAEKLEDDRLV